MQSDKKRFIYSKIGLFIFIVIFSISIFLFLNKNIDLKSLNEQPKYWAIITGSLLYFINYILYKKGKDLYIIGILIFTFLLIGFL